MWNKDELSPDELDRLMQDAADDADAERAYQEMLGQEAWLAEQAAADADAEAAYEDLDERETVDKETTMHRLPILYTTHLDTLYDANLLCAICETAPWTQEGRYHAVLLCEDCAQEEPYPNEGD